MDWRAVRFDWNRARAFMVTAEEGSLSAAARALGQAQPTLGRQVEALEAELGVVLFERVGRGLTLTPTGLDLLDHVRAMAEGARRLSLAAAGQSQVTHGKVVIAASDVYAAFVLPPILARLRALHPGITVEVVVSAQASDLRRREADIAIRNFRPEESDLVARKIREVPARFYASPAYLGRLGPVAVPADLVRAEFVSIDGSGMFLKGLQAMGIPVTEANFPILTENFLVMWEMVKAGLGIGILDGRIGDAEPAVVRVLPEAPPLMFPIWLVAHRELGTSRRIRLVYDLLAEML